MVRNYSIISILLTFVFAGSAQATVLIDDNGADQYIGGIILGGTISGGTIIGGTIYSEDPNVDPLGGGDAIGSTYDMSTMTVGINDTPDHLTVVIEATNGYFDHYLQAGNNPVQLGDLFISTDDWSPFGTAPYGMDVVTNGEDWEYALVLDNHDTTSGTLSLYEVVSPTTNLILSTDPGGGYRPGQEVQYGVSGQSALAGSGTWGIAGNILTFDFNFAGSGMTLSEDDFAMRWTMTCANDIVEGGSPVPEPATMLLFGTGLIGLLGTGVSRRKKKE